MAQDHIYAMQVQFGEDLNAGESMPPPPPPKTTFSFHVPDAAGQISSLNVPAPAVPGRALKSPPPMTTSSMSTPGGTESTCGTALGFGNEWGVGTESAVGNEWTVGNDWVGIESAIGNEWTVGNDWAVGNEGTVGNDWAVGTESAVGNEWAFGNESAVGTESAHGIESASAPASVHPGITQAQANPDPIKEEECFAIMHNPTNNRLHLLNVKTGQIFVLKDYETGQHSVLNPSRTEDLQIYLSRDMAVRHQVDLMQNQMKGMGQQLQHNP